MATLDVSIIWKAQHWTDNYSIKVLHSWLDLPISGLKSTFEFDTTLRWHIWDKTTSRFTKDSSYCSIFNLSSWEQLIYHLGSGKYFGSSSECLHVPSFLEFQQSRLFWSCMFSRANRLAWILVSQHDANQWFRSNCGNNQTHRYNSALRSHVPTSFRTYARVCSHLEATITLDSSQKSIFHSSHV